jgi:6-phosphogluconate dehydrogenase
MQLISDACGIMQYALGMSAPGMAKVFAAFDKTELNSYLCIARHCVWRS